MEDSPQIEVQASTYVMPTVAVFGMGRTGLPVAMSFAAAGVSVVGIEKNPKIVEKLRSSETTFYEEGMDYILKRSIGKYFEVREFDSVPTDIWRNVQYLLVHVGLSISDLRKKDTPVRQVIDQIINLGLEGKIVIFRTTVPVGFTRKAALFLEKKSGLKQGVDFHVAFVPERLWEGHAVEDSSQLPHVIGSLSEEGAEKIENLFSKVGGRKVRVSKPEIAEVIKLAENSWRDTTFAFANDLAMACDRLGVDMYEVQRAANIDYNWNNIPLPGPVSGYCLRKDPMILAASEPVDEERKQRLWVSGRGTNENLLKVVVKRVKNSGAKAVVVAGLSFKGNVDDFRDSHSLTLVDDFRKLRLIVYGVDKFAGMNAYTTAPKLKAANVVRSIAELGDKVKSSAVVLATPHDDIKADEFVSFILEKKPKLVVDMWGMLRKHEHEFRERGIAYSCIGSGTFWK